MSRAENPDDLTVASATTTCSDTLDEMAEWTAEMVGGAFGRWPVEVRCLDLVEEVGELARAVLVDQGHKAPPGEDLTVAVCGVLMDLLIVAHDSGVRIGAAYPDLVEKLVRQDPEPAARACRGSGMIATAGAGRC